ncbi:uncharacterized protein [Phyllobates terribilis]|uniref:uncharacterized protein n=1 Tax=Phyllobates terribilis TaxID=111132 RepID=UPI003CCB327B
MEFVRNMERRRLIKPQDILATLQSIPEDESESELQEHVFDSDSDEDFIPQNISSESEDSEGTNPEDIPSTSTGDRAHAVMLPRDHPPGRGEKKSAKRPRNERTTDNDGGEGNATTNTREGESEGILVSADGIQWKPVEIGEHLPGRRDSQNILREAPGPTGYARRNIIIDSPLSDIWENYCDQKSSSQTAGSHYIANIAVPFDKPAWRKVIFVACDIAQKLVNQKKSRGCWEVALGAHIHRKQITDGVDGEGPEN